MNDMNKKFYQLAPDLAICRIINGMVEYHYFGFTTWDLADIYGPAEDFIGDFRRRLLGLKGKEELDRIQSWVPQPGRITRTIVNEDIERSLRRMSVSSLDLLHSTGGIITIRIIWAH
jgi:diketogulonate reductase-like aldo/keto reductase